MMTKAACALAGGTYAGDYVKCSGFRLGVQCCVGTTANIDCDSTGSVDISDLSALIDGLYVSLQPFCCGQTADLDGDGNVDISDISVLIDNLYVAFTPLRPCQ
jgi:hypothetical protein